MTQVTAVRTVSGVELPSAGTWTIDPTHTTIGFVARHMMVTKVRGAFVGFEGEAEIAEDPALSRVEVSVDIASVTTGAEDRDNHLRSADFFDAEAFPTMTFVGTSLEGQGTERKLHGELTIRDTTLPVTLDVEFLGAVQDPWGNDKAAFSASTEINREDFGLTWNAALEGGGVLVSKTVKIEIEAQLLRG